MAETLNVGGGDYIGEWQPRKSRNQNQRKQLKQVTPEMLSTSEKYGGECGRVRGNECTRIIGNDYVISRSRPTFLRSNFAYLERASQFSGRCGGGARRSEKGFKNSGRRQKCVSGNAPACCLHQTYFVFVLRHNRGF